MRSPWACTALAVALLLWAPNLAWQVANGVPQLEMAAAIARGGSDERIKVVIELLLIAGPFLFPVAVVGGWRLLRNPAASLRRATGFMVADLARPPPPQLTREDRPCEKRSPRLP